jgi:hypothetical protein
MCITNFGPRPTKLIPFDLSVVENVEVVAKTVSAEVPKACAVQPATQPTAAVAVAARPKPETKDRTKSVTKRLPPGLTTKNHQRRFVQHRYRDHSEEKPLSEEEDLIQKTLHVVENNGSYALSVDSEALNSVKRDPRGGVPVPFPLKLHELLDTIEADGHADVLSWQPHGRSFRVHKTKEFVETIMPRYFRQSKLTSFQRQLNLYGFARITKGRDKGGYYHELFLRGKLFLANRIQRNKVKGTKIKAVTSPETEPDFYSMPFIVITSKAPGMVTTTLTKDSPVLVPVVSSESLADVIKSSRVNAVDTSLKESDEASFEGMPFHLVSDDQLVSSCLPVASFRSSRMSWVSDESSLASGDGCSLDDISDVIARQEIASFAEDGNDVPIPSLSFSSQETSPYEQDECSLSESTEGDRITSNNAMTKEDDDDLACFEGMVFHLVSPDETPALEEMPRSTTLLKTGVISISSMSSASDGSSTDTDDEGFLHRPYAVDVVSKTCPNPFDEWFYEDEEMRLLLD